MSLLTIVQGAAASLNVPVPTSVVGNSNQSSVLFLALAQREGRELSRRHDWQNLIVQKTWTTTATVVQSLALPTTDYQRLPPDAEVWNRSSNALLTGPTPSNIWQRLQTGVTGGTNGWWRIINNALNIYPAPTAGQTYALEYISKNWCQSSLFVAQSAWAADTDTALLPEDLMELGLVWRWLKTKGMDYAEEMATYEREVEKAASRDRGLRMMAVNTWRDDLPPPFWSGTIST